MINRLRSSYALRAQELILKERNQEFLRQPRSR